MTKDEEACFCELKSRPSQKRLVIFSIQNTATWVIVAVVKHAIFVLIIQLLELRNLANTKLPKSVEGVTIFVFS